MKKTLKMTRKISTTRDCTTRRQAQALLSVLLPRDPDPRARRFATQYPWQPELLSRTEPQWQSCRSEPLCWVTSQHVSVKSTRLDPKSRRSSAWQPSQTNSRLDSPACRATRKDRDRSIGRDGDATSLPMIHSFF